MADTDAAKTIAPEATPPEAAPSFRAVLHDRLCRASQALSGMALGGLAISSMLVVVFWSEPKVPSAMQTTASSQPAVNPAPSPAMQPLVRQVPTLIVSSRAGNATPPSGQSSAPAHQGTAPPHTEPQQSNTTVPHSEPSRPAPGALPDAGTGAAVGANVEPPAWSEHDVSTALKECLRLLGPASVEVEPQPPIRNGQCGLPAPVALHAAGKDKVILPSPAISDCAVAAALSRWVDQSLQPAAREVLGSPVVKLVETGAYSCRNRNNEKTGPISEHAFGNAIDIGGFVLADGRTITVLDGWGPAARDASPAGQEVKTAAVAQGASLPARTARALVGGERPSALGGPVAATPAPAEPPHASPTPVSKFLHRIHDEGCKIFWTVLSPEANEAHRNHLHFDMKVRKSQHICH